ncbi:MAG: hypothetical protein V2A66_03805, partial [Pseudomonadota bacterium]
MARTFPKNAVLISVAVHAALIVLIAFGASFLKEAEFQRPGDDGESVVDVWVEGSDGGGHTRSLAAPKTLPGRTTPSEAGVGSRLASGGEGVSPSE